MQCNLTNIYLHRSTDQSLGTTTGEAKYETNNHNLLWASTIIQVPMNSFGNRGVNSHRSSILISN